jgi:hypothetical protein
VTESVARDGHEAAIFAFLHSSQKGQPYPQLYLRGLDPNAVYSIHAHEGKLADGTVQRASGDYWMHHGVSVSLRGDFQAAFFTLERERAQYSGEREAKSAASIWRGLRSTWASESADASLSTLSELDRFVSSWAKSVA